MLEVTAFVAVVAVALIIGDKVFGWRLWGVELLQPNYNAGIIVGVGLGLVLHQVLIGLFGIDSDRLPLIGGVIVFVGTCVATYVQVRAARNKVEKL